MLSTNCWGWSEAKLSLGTSILLYLNIHWHPLQATASSVCFQLQDPMECKYLQNTLTPQSETAKILAALGGFRHFFSANAQQQLSPIHTYISLRCRQQDTSKIGSGKWVAAGTICRLLRTSPSTMIRQTSTFSSQQFTTLFSAG